MTSDRTGVRLGSVEVVVEGYHNQIRKRERMNVRADLIILLPQLAKMYGGSKEIETKTLSEAVRLIFKKFGALSVEEIKEAYRDYYSGELKVKGAEMYGGIFNVGAMAKILGAYKERRRKVLGEYLVMADKERDKIEEEKRKEESMKDFEVQFPILLVKGQEEIKNWRGVPSWWYRPAFKRGWIEFEEGEAQKIYRVAGWYAQKQIERFREERRRSQFSERVRMFEPDFEPLRKQISGQIAVWRKIVNNSQFKIEKNGGF